MNVKTGMCKHQVRLPNQGGKFKLTAFTPKDKNVEVSGNNNNQHHPGNSKGRKDLILYRME